MCAYVDAFAQQVPGAAYFLPPLDQLPAVPLTRKRPLEGDILYGEAPAKRLATIPDVIFRLLVSANRIGKVIGKQGSQIRLLRQETGANIKIADAGTAFEDRVIVISSKREEALGVQSAAEHALVRVATAVIEERGDENPLGKMGQSGGNLTRLLISRSEAGCLIGKAGAAINCIRESSGASIRILPSDQLPLCSFASETDRLVQISGDLSHIQKALELIGSKLRENPSNDIIMLRPNYLYTPQQMPYAQVPYASYATQHFGNVNNMGAPAIAPSAITVPGMAPYAGVNMQVPMVPAVAKITAEISVPSALIGGVIGRGGAKITQIRTYTGCTVKVSGQKEGQMERKISFEGTPEQVAAAQNLVQAFMGQQ